MNSRASLPFSLDWLIFLLIPLAAEYFLERKETLLRSDILRELADAQSVVAEGGWEWLGDYPQERVRRTKGKKLLSIPEAFPVYEVPQKDALEHLNEPVNDRSKRKRNG